MYKPNDQTANWEAPPGVAPWRELSDDEYAALTSEHGDLSRWFDHVKEKKSKGGDD